MKLRIKDNSVRFRITLKEWETLRDTHRLSAVTRVPGRQHALVEFRYGISRDPDATDSRLEVAPFQFVFVLGREDFEALSDPAREGVYCREEWQRSDGEIERFIVFVEKERPGAACEKPEAWIYEETPGRPPSTRPIPRKELV